MAVITKIIFHDHKYQLNTGFGSCLFAVYPFNMCNYIALLIPLMLLIVGIEWYVSVRKGNGRYNTANTVNNMAIGAIDQVSSLFYVAFMYLVMEFSYRHFRLFELKADWSQWVLGFLAIEFLSYWYHRWSHRVNILWAGHVTHHSSELYNFSVGFRGSLFQGINRIVFWAFLPVFGFSPIILLVLFKLGAIWCFIVHTTYIPKLGFLEKILITPSMHRVHHGKNELYIDKNYGSTLVIFDKLFGTYQEETEPVVYGIKGDYADNNPVNAVFHHYKHIFRNLKNTQGLVNKFKVLFMPPDWVPPGTDLHRAENVSSTQINAAVFYKYAFLQVVCCVPGFVAFLFFNPVLTTAVFWLIALSLVLSMIGAGRILKQNLNVGFGQREMLRQVIGLGTAAYLIVLTGNSYLWILLVYYLLSIQVLLQAMAEAKSAITSES